MSLTSLLSLMSSLIQSGSQEKMQATASPAVLDQVPASLGTMWFQVDLKLLREVIALSVGKVFE